MIKKIDFSCLVFVLFILATINSSCQKPQPTESEADPSSETPGIYSYLPTDTIPEKTDPASLDLSQDLLFIDTTKNSNFYENLVNWQPSKFRVSSVKEILDTINKTSTPTPISKTTIPRTFMSIKKLNGEYLLYDRCDGIELRYVIQDSAVIIHGVLESDAYAIIQIKENTPKKLSLQIQGYPGAYSDNLPFSIEKTEEDFIYKISEPHDTVLAIPVEHISEFEILVNHCVSMKMLEFEGFDNYE